jgi:ATP-dependent helicase/nuclease subunit B
VLRLDPLEPFLSDPGPRERGTLYHAILEELVGSLPPAERDMEALRAIAERHFQDAALPGATALVWRSRFEKAAKAIVEWEAKNAGGCSASRVEARASLEIPGAGIRLTGMADRIDLRADGSAWIIDYKTGGAPTRKQARILLDPQLALEAHALRHGGFADLGRREASALLYLRLTGKDPFAERVDTDLENPGKTEVLTPSDLAQKAADELTRFVSLLKSGKRGFLSRAIPRSARDFAGDYDHLARVAEWQTAIDPEAGDSDE